MFSLRLSEMLPIILLMVPLAMAHINTEVFQTIDGKIKVQISGESSRRTTVNDLNTAKLTEEYIIHLIRSNNFFTPCEIYYFHTDEGQPLVTTVKPVKVTIVSEDRQRETLTVNYFHNIYPHTKKTKEELSSNVKEWLNCTWSSNALLPVTRNIDAELKSNLSLNSNAGGDQYVEKMITMKSNFDLTLREDQKAKAVLSATHARATVQIDYEATITGDIYYTYCFFGFACGYLQRINHNSLPFSETLELNYYYDDHVDKIEEEYPDIDVRYKL